MRRRKEERRLTVQFMAIISKYWNRLDATKNSESSDYFQ